MRHQNYALTPIQITNALPRTRPYKLTDGAGLHLVVSPGGTKAWRYQYRYAGVRCDVGIGTFPEIGIADARDQHQRYRSMLERGLDPAVARRQQVRERRDLSSMARRRADDFEAFSKRWVEERMTTRSATYRAQILSRLERFVWPLIGTKPLGSVRPVDMLRVIEPLTLTPNTAEGVRVPTTITNWHPSPSTEASPSVAYSTPSRTPFRRDGGQHSAVMADSVAL